MLEIVFRPEAEADIREIADYTEAQWGRAQAKRYAETLNTAIERLAEFPEIGASTEGLASNYRKLPSGSHRIYYRVDADRLIVIRILHERMDADGQLD